MAQTTWNNVFPGTSPRKAKSKAIKLILWWVRLPFKIMYYIYVFPFVFAVQKYFQFLSWSVHLILEQNNRLNHLSSKLYTAQARVEEIVMFILSSKLSEFVPFCVNVVLETIISFFWPPQKSSEFDHSYSLEDLSELLAYEEYEGEDSELSQNALNAQNNNNNHFAKSLLLMHSYIPTKPFRATVRRVRKSQDSTPTSGTDSRTMTAGSSLKHRLKFGSNSSSSTAVATLNHRRHTGQSSPTHPCLMSTYDLLGTDSPASFPSTPFSRAYVMNKSSEKVVSVMFAARDKLRLEAQSVSRDEYSSLVAREAKTSGQLAMFDDTQTSSGIALSCGNHCAIKVGKGLCCSCRSKAPVRTNSYVYLEFSITVSNAQIPNLGVGLAPLESPLNVMVGSWPKSVGLYTDGQLWIGSQSQMLGAGENRMSAGSTVGMLVHITEENVDSPIARLRADSKFAGPLRSPTMAAAAAVGGSGRMGPLMEGPSNPSSSGSSGSSGNSAASEAKVVVGIADLEAADMDTEESDNNSSKKDVTHSYESAVEPTAPAPVAAPVATASSSCNNSNKGNDLLRAALMTHSQLKGSDPPSDLVLPGEAAPPAVGRRPLRLALPKPSISTSPVLARMSLQFNINGRVLESPREVRDTIAEIPSCSAGGSVAATTLYPTVSILTEDTRVWCRFCAEDVVYRSRRAIGAPDGVRVYCLDGSLLIKETD